MLMLDKVRVLAEEFDILHFHIDQYHFPLFREMAGRTVTTRQPFWLFAAEGAPSMCDYSLHYVASRPAKIEDKLKAAGRDPAFSVWPAPKWR